MSSEIALAFAHPHARSEATAKDGPLDRISLRDHIVEVEIGAFQAERGTTQRVCFNIVVEVVPEVDLIDDDVDRILSYDKVTEAIALELGAERLNLLETLAQRIADRILVEPQARRTFVRIEKLDRGPGALGVEIVRDKPHDQTPPVESPALLPLVVYLSNASIAAPLLSKWLDQLEGLAMPVVICVGSNATEAPRADHPLAQRRIDLLAIEQNAWILAARDARCVVVSTRTELDWAMKQGQLSVWAPSKIVLDAVDSPSAEPKDTVALSAWFAAHMDARELLLIGAEVPQKGRVAMRAVALDQTQLFPAPV